MVLLNSFYSNAVMEPVTWLAVGLALADLVKLPAAESRALESRASWRPARTVNATPAVPSSV
jgi:hypothetical protein